jgi:hypothetical protein
VKTLTPVFISYDQRDRSFVKLLHKLLEHEGVESWFDRDQKNAAGEKHKDRAQSRLERARSLIVVVSEHALSSPRVHAELDVFRLCSVDATIIPLLLDSTCPASVDSCLDAEQAIDMRADMLAGFVALFARYSRAFLSGQGQRRAQANRRVKPDRRGAILRRLRVGLWQQYAHTTGLGKFDTVDIRRHSSAKMVAALRIELAKYDLHDQSKRVIDASWALSQALASIDIPGARTKAVYLIDKLAGYLYEHFDVRSRDRRQQVEQQRAEAGPRRKIHALSVEP